MLFNSIQFLIFFPIVTAIYFFLPKKGKNIFLLLASYYFYMSWKPEYVFLILISTLIDYVCGIMMGKEEAKSGRRKYLLISIFSNLGLLFSFKYLNFFSTSLNDLFAILNIFYNLPAYKLLLPVGISFYTFQTMSYTLDIYRGKLKPERNFKNFALFVTFFPQLVAGPIERATKLLPQFENEQRYDYQRVIDGIKLMLWGLFKKVVIADRLAFFVNHVYSQPTQYEGAPLIIATIFFSFQIYCDFSGYSDIAIGSAQVLGFDLMDNFRRPYHSKSISEFWKRWHISLSSWFKDYLYIPLGGNRVAVPRWYFNIFVVFVVSGLWHGANWTFVVWGALHGFYSLVSIMTEKFRNRINNFTGLSDHIMLHKFWKVIFTFSLVTFSWIFFRANSITDAFYIVTHLLPIDFSFLNINSKVFLNQPIAEFYIAVLAIIFMETVHLLQRHREMRHMFTKEPLWVKPVFYGALALLILLFGQFQLNQFIYFQF
ncbi:MBOAT family protein [Candidatus Parcubacteria bacterium]|nr:MAG: MBOAT family protein [Candidatus Parcubacteria bacterium]